MLEVFALSPSHYRSRGNHVAAVILASVVLTVTLVVLVNVYEPGSRLSTLPGVP
jgi:hypothetical protein